MDKTHQGVQNLNQRGKEMLEKLNNLMKMDTGESGGDGNGEAGEQNNAGEQGEQNQTTFTQADLNRIATKESKEAATKMLKELGFEDAEKAKEFLKKAREAEEAQKTEAQKTAEAKAAAEAEAQAAKAEADAIRLKLDVAKSGALATAIEDAAILIANRMTAEGCDFKTASEAVKKAYPMMFGESGSTGTGGKGNPPRTPQGGEIDFENLGKSLAEEKNQTATTKHEFFTR